VKTIWLIPPAALQYATGREPERGLLECFLAGVRLRVAVAALEWTRAGNENSFRDPGEPGGRGVLDWEPASLCVVPKYYHDLPLQPWLDACVAAKSNGCRLVIDICDNPFTKPPPVPEFYSKVLTMCDAVAVNSAHMAELMAPHCAQPPLLIEDAILAPKGAPAFAPARTVELLWFGHPSNFQYLDACIDALGRFAAGRHCRLTVVTHEEVGVEEWARDVSEHLAPAFEARFVPWSLQAMQDALHQCDLVLIPSDPADPLKAGASANRIAEALNAGRFPVASPLPSYLAFADAAWLGENLVPGIEWALAHRDEVLARIRRGQALVTERFSAEMIGGQWRELFEQLRMVSSPRSG
jgi:hypothetical protein